jgi:glutamate carboxypeptidase
MTGTATGRDILETARSLKEEAVSFLGDLVNINSWSKNPAGINQVGEVIREKLGSGYVHRPVTDDEGVNHHIFESGVRNSSAILLAGHLDTVFAPGFEGRPFGVSGENILGPGTADMKGGVVVIIYALEILSRLGLLAPVPVRIFLNGDEELGSPRSAPYLASLASQTSDALVFECGGLSGEVVHSRRGVARFRLDVTGSPRHAGVKSGPKASAIVELARMVLELEQLNEMGQGIMCNVGVISGGVQTNIVPDQAHAMFEVRYWETAQENQVRSRIREIVNGFMPDGCSAELVTLHSRPAWSGEKASAQLLDKVREAAGELGQEVPLEKRGGSSDANILAAYGVPTVDGLGPVGDLDHSPEEYIVADSLVERIALTALLLLKLSE